MLFLDGVYIERCNGSSRFRWVSAIAPALPYYTPSPALKAPTSRELTQLAHTIAHRVGRYLERQGLLERDAENSYLAGDAVDDDPMSQPDSCINPTLFFKQTAHIQHEPPVARLLLDRTKSEVQKTA